MEEKLITFETAKLAKEKGFDIIQRYGQEASLYNKDGKHTYYMNYGFMYSGLSDGYISAPTQFLLQKWLREKHEILVIPLYGYNDNPHFTVHVEDINKMNIDEYSLLISGIDFFPMLFDTYELALETGLQIAMKILVS